MGRPSIFSWSTLAMLTFGQPFFGQAPDNVRELKLRDWKPRSMLVTQVTRVDKPAFPVVDVHNHLGGGADILTPTRVREYLAEIDAAGVRTVVNLDGGWDQRLVAPLTFVARAHFEARHPPDGNRRQNPMNKPGRYANSD